MHKQLRRELNAVRLEVYLDRGGGGSTTASTASSVTIVTHLRLVHQDKNRVPLSPDTHTSTEHTHTRAHTSMSAHKRTHSLTQMQRGKHNLIREVHVTGCCCSQCAGVHVKHHLGPAGASKPNKRGENKKTKRGREKEVSNGWCSHL